MQEKFENVHFSLFWGGWKYCQSFVKPDHLLVKCLSLTWKTFASISSEQRIVKLHWDIEYGFFCLKNMIKTTKCQFYSLFFLGFILPLPIFLKLNFVFLFVFKNYYENNSATLKAYVSDEILSCHSLSLNADLCILLTKPTVTEKWFKVQR